MGMVAEFRTNSPGKFEGGHMFRRVRFARSDRTAATILFSSIVKCVRATLFGHQGCSYAFA
jgi:hypothetical protein